MPSGTHPIIINSRVCREKLIKPTTILKKPFYATLNTPIKNTIKNLKTGMDIGDGSFTHYHNKR
ncbi:protein of unknown function [Serratia sp. Tan611]|nr:protein of unknown function [Serratia sp. Tan611]